MANQEEEIRRNENKMTAREHLLILTAAIFTAQHVTVKPKDDIFEIIDKALKTAEVYLAYCEKKMGITYNE